MVNIYWNLAGFFEGFSTSFLGVFLALVFSWTGRRTVN